MDVEGVGDAGVSGGGNVDVYELQAFFDRVMFQLFTLRSDHKCFICSLFCYSFGCRMLIIPQQEVGCTEFFGFSQLNKCRKIHFVLSLSEFLFGIIGFGFLILDYIYFFK